eukprot:SM000008S22160  [mRNA]  locus=s8:124151:127335:+ [translate_table: standard]
MAPEPLPPYPASIKDGYAVVAADGPGEYTVVAEVRAGDDGSPLLRPSDLDSADFEGDGSDSDLDADGDGWGGGGGRAAWSRAASTSSSAGLPTSLPTAAPEPQLGLWPPRSGAGQGAARARPPRGLMAERDWEEAAYDIIRRQKQREFMATARQVALHKAPAVGKPSSLVQHWSEETGKSGHRRPRGPSGEGGGEAGPGRASHSSPERVTREHGASIGDTDAVGPCKSIDDASFNWLLTKHNFEPKWRLLVDYLYSLGLDKHAILLMAERHKGALSTSAAVADSRLKHLQSLGVKPEDLRKLLMRHPQIVEYKEECSRQRVEYLLTLGVPKSHLGRVIMANPAILSSSIKRTLQSRAQYLVSVVGIAKEDVGKVVARSPQVLTQSIEQSLSPRVNFLRTEVGLSSQQLARMIFKHPQLLHYSVHDGMRPRIAYLRSIGLTADDISKVLMRLTQIFSLSVSNTLQPKLEYLLEELKCDLKVVVSYPAYFSLSLEQRIKPRHKFLVSLKRLPRGAFPMKYLALTDKAFCTHVAQTSEEDYQSFRQGLLLSQFAERFQRRHKLPT